MPGYTEQVQLNGNGHYSGIGCDVNWVSLTNKLFMTSRRGQGTSITMLSAVVKNKSLRFRNGK